VVEAHVTADTEQRSRRAGADPVTQHPLTAQPDFGVDLVSTREAGQGRPKAAQRESLDGPVNDTGILDREPALAPGCHSSART